MFLNMLRKRNPSLVRGAGHLHQKGAIPPNTYVVDLDSLEENVRFLSDTADEYGLTLYYMTKQLGRSGFIGNAIEQNGISKAVAVDIDEALNLNEAGCQIGNIGHLVQPGKTQWLKVLTSLQPEVVTLFSMDRARQLSEAALSLGKQQDVILRVISRDGFTYPGQYGGFDVDDLEEVVSELKRLQGIKIIGATSFPIFQLNQTKSDFEFTSNIHTLMTARNVLSQSGLNVCHLNAPGSTSCQTIPLLKRYGITHGEPGHALTGTTPLHAYNDSLLEKPCIAYVSEISHMDDEHAYTIAGGFYARSNMEKALYGTTPAAIEQQETQTCAASIENIDYYGSLKRKQGMKTGDTVLYSFRTQIFVTRAHVAFVRNLDSLSPEIVYFQRRGV